MLTQARLQEVLHYEPETGEFVWLERLEEGARSDLVGEQAGCLHWKGYLNIMIDGKEYRAHRLAWLYMYGSFPKNQLDHINRDRVDNRIANLRLASNSQNGANSNAKPSFSGLKGAHWHSRDKKWFSAIYYNGKKHHLGRFATAEEAHAAYCEAAEKMHGEFFWSGKSEGKPK
jgi:hypothetical protein